MPEAEQIRNIDRQAERGTESEKPSVFSITDEFVDICLRQGSGFQNGKYRIQLLYSKVGDPRERVKYLKSEYTDSWKMSMRSMVGYHYRKRSMHFQSRNNFPTSCREVKMRHPSNRCLPPYHTKARQSPRLRFQGVKNKRLLRKLKLNRQLNTLRIIQTLSPPNISI